LVCRLEGALLSPGRGNIRIYRVCAECHAASQGIGDIVSVGGVESCLIV